MELINGNCLQELITIPSNSVDLVYLDLPFGILACKWDKKVNLKYLWTQLKRIAKNERTPFFFSCTTKFGFELIEANKSWFRWDLVWKKNRGTSFLNAYKLPIRKHEMIYCFAKKCPEYDVSSHNTGNITVNKPTTGHTFVDDAIGHRPCHDKPHISKEVKVPLPTSDITPTTDPNGYCEHFDINKTGKRNQGVKDQPRLPTSDITETDQPSSWCEYSLDTKTGHRTAKPVALMEFLLKYWSKEGDTVLDPTMGSGSMGIACKNMNRKFIGIELDEDIFKLAEERLK